jgi:cytochrome b561
MRMRNSQSSYGAVSRTLHWVVAILVIGALALIESRGWFPRGAPERTAFAEWHYQLGLAAFALVWLRLVWRASEREPATVPPITRWEHAASHAVQAAFYLLLAVLPPLGFATAQAQGHDVAFLGLTIPKLVATSKPLAAQLKEVHEYLGHDDRAHRAARGGFTLAPALPPRQHAAAHARLESRAWSASRFPSSSSFSPVAP